jgi:hypothetical protein
MLNGAWLRHQAKAAIVTYLSPLTGGIGDEIDIAPSTPLTTQASEQAAKPPKASNEQIFNIAELIDSLSMLQADIIRIVDPAINDPQGQAVVTANEALTTHDSNEKNSCAPTFAKKDG